MAIFKCSACSQTKVIAGPNPSELICTECAASAPILLKRSEVATMRHEMLLAGWSITSREFTSEAIRRVLAAKFGADFVKGWSLYDFQHKTTICED